MALDFQRFRFFFQPATGGPQFQSRTLIFPGTIRKAEVAINGFDIGFTNSDHHLLRQQIDASVFPTGANGVVVSVNFSLRDSSGTFDDPYSGFVDVLVIADLA